MRGAFVLLGLFTGAALMCTACQPGDAQGARAIADYRLIEKACAAAGIPYPPPKLFIRAFKQERELEIWGAESERFHFLQTYPIVGVSGGPGPKRREGDRQIPEGVYHIDRFNPNSRFHLSLGLSYPNKADRLLGDPERPGSDIFIHGSNVSIGCMAMTDEKIEVIYALAKSARSQISVHVFPCRMEGTTYSELRRQHPQHNALWDQLEAIYRAFEANRRVPLVTITGKGRYEIRKD